MKRADAVVDFIRGNDAWGEASADTSRFSSACHACRGSGCFLLRGDVDDDEDDFELLLGDDAADRYDDDEDCFFTEAGVEAPPRDTFRSLASI